MLGKIFSQVKNLVKRAVVTKAGDDIGQYNIQQASWLTQKVGDTEIIFPYGMSANLPVGASLWMFNIGANEQNRAALGNLPKERKRELADGEVAFFHPLTNSFIYFRNSGDIDIDTGGASVYTPGEAVGDPVGANINITCNNTNITCNEKCTVTAAEDISLTATENVDISCVVATITASTSMTFDTPTATFTGNVVVDGGISVTGASTLSGTVTSGGVNIGNSHVHPILGGSSAPGPTGGPQ